MHSTTALITGANRGIGLGLATALLERSDTDVTLAVRNQNSAAPCRQLLHDYAGRCRILPMDVADADGISKAAAQFTQAIGKLDLLINCAGINKDPRHDPSASKGPVSAVVPAAIDTMFWTNVLGPVSVAQHLLPVLTASAHPRVINISTIRGSLTHVENGRSIGYGLTKSALNMFTRKLAHELVEYQGVSVAVDPGWVRTEMGGTEAPATVAEAADDIIALIDALDNKHNGMFVSRHGEFLEW